MKIRQHFRQSLKCGTGRAYFILKSNPKIDFSKEIEKAALTNYAYDPQCEGDRAFYISQLLELSDKKERIVEIVTKALARERKSEANLEQLFELAAIFANQDYSQAKKAIYKRFHNKIIRDAEYIGQEAILKISGIEGLKYIAVIRGKMLIKNPDDWEDSFIADCFQEVNPKIDVYNELKKASKNNLYIKKYFETIKKNKWTGPVKRKRPKYDYSLVKERIEKGFKVPVPPSVARGLKKIDIKQLADDFLQEKDLVKKQSYLSVFSRVKFPYDYQPILRIAKKGKNSRNNRMVEFACESLASFESADIRQFAIRKLSKTTFPYIYLPLLVANYKGGDHVLLENIAERYKNENMIHGIACGYIDIYKANKTINCKRPLEIIYEKLTCGLHRFDIVKILYENGALSSKILQELEFDSNEQIRAFYKQITK